MVRLAEANIAKKNSGTFYFSARESGYDWTQPQSDDLWQDNIKTLSDPCPMGWRVPKGGTRDSSVWSVFTTANGTWTPTDTPDTPGRGYRWTTPQVTGGSVWYGTHPHRPVSAVQFAAGSAALNWTTTVTAASAYRSSMSADTIQASQSAGRTNGLPVRCIRE